MPRQRLPKWNLKWFRKSGAHFFKLSFKILPLIVIAGSVSFVSFGVKQMLQADPYFQVERVTVFPSGILTQSEYQFLEHETRSRSLVEVDLGKISKNLERNPKIKRAEVVRTLPNQLNVLLTMRLPFIQIQFKPNGSFYTVSSDQLVLSNSGSPKPDLVVLQDFGAEKKIYSVGTLYQNKYFYRLPSVLDFIRTNSILSSETISQMSMDQLGNITLFLKDGLELRFSNEIGLSDAKRAVLSSLLKSNERNQILYIDLRYQDIIVKKRSQSELRPKTR